jgi:hypothetical protein
MRPDIPYLQLSHDQVHRSSMCLTRVKEEIWDVSDLRRNTHLSESPWYPDRFFNFQSSLRHVLAPRGRC